MTTLANSGDQAALLEHDQRFFDALVAGDIGKLGELLADDFLLISIGNGATVTKADMLDAISSGAIQFPAIETFHDEALVRRIGDVGIVVGRTGMSFKSGSDTSFTVDSRYTHVFAFDPTTGWQLLSAQGTEIKADPA